MKTMSIKGENGDVLMQMNYASTVSDGDACELAYMLLEQLALSAGYSIPECFGYILEEKQGGDQ